MSCAEVTVLWISISLDSWKLDLMMSWRGFNSSSVQVSLGLNGGEP